MNVFLSYLTLAILFVSILFMGWQVNRYLRLKRVMGKLLVAVTPSQLQRKVLMGIVAIFIVFMVIVTFQYTAQGEQVGPSFAVVLAVVIYSSGRFISRLIDIRETGILGQLNEIPFKSFSSFKTESLGGRSKLTLTLKDGRNFMAVYNNSDEEKIKKILKSRR